MEASAAFQSRLIGAIFVEKNLITAEQLERALQLQADTGDRLGEIVVAEFGVARLELAGVLAEQWAELEDANREVAPGPDRPAQPPEPLTPAEVQIRRPLGEIFVELGFVNSDQLDAALGTQRETGARIGEILVEQGSLTRLDLASALAEQWSALQKLRPPTPAADLQPWQNGSPVASPAEQGRSAQDSAAAAGLDERLRVVERAASATPWQEDLRLVTSDLRAAVRAVEVRLEASVSDSANAELSVALEALSVRIDALESVPASTKFDALHQELEELKARPVTVEALADLGAAVERLEGRPDRADEIVHLASEITALAGRLDELAGIDELTDKLDAVAGQAEVVQTGIAGLSRRVDDLGGLESRLDEVAARLPDDEVIEDLRRALAELPTQAGDDDGSDLGVDVAALVARIDELAARVEDVAATPGADLTPRIDDLSARVDEVAAAIPVIETDGLAERIATLEEGNRAGTGALERLATEIGELGSRTQGRLDALSAREPDWTPVEELRARVDELAAVVEREPGMAPLNEIRARLEELAAAVERDESVSALEARMGELEHQLAAAAPAAELREEMRRVAESTIVERESLTQALFARVEEFTATVPREDELAELRSRLDELATRPTEDSALEARVDEVSTRLDRLAALEEAIADLRESFDGLDTVRTGDAVATGARLAGLEAAVDALAGLETRVREGVDHDLAERADDLVARLDGAESRLDTLVALEDRVAALAVDVQSRPDDHALAGVVADLRAKLVALAERLTIADPSERLLELSQTIDRSARDGHDRIGGIAEELNLRIAEADRARATEQQELENRMGEAAAAMSSDRDAREQVLAARLVDEIGAVRSEFGERESALAGRLDDAVGAIRVDLETRGAALGSQLADQSSEAAALRAGVEELQKAAAGRMSFETRLESLLEQRLDELAGRIAGEVAGVRAYAEQATAAVRGETGSLGARVDELLGLRHADAQAARAASEQLAERVEVLAGLRADDAESARAAAADLSGRLERLAESLHAEAAGARTAAEGVAAQIGHLSGLRGEDLAAAELAGAELSARLDDHAMRSAEAAFQVEQALRVELGGIAAQLEERDAQGIEAREDLRGELERVASSVGWRLERIEESLASDDSAELKVTVAELEHRLEGQVAMGEEQVRVTERAIRKGLASLGERLVDSESAYVEAGNTLRRSIERLGAAVVEADARMADQIPVSEAEGCVAFAPTAVGYRLVALPGKPPEIGSTVELEACDGPLLVTRYGRSPLPLDNRPCAYLDRV